MCLYRPTSVFVIVGWMAGVLVIVSAYSIFVIVGWMLGVLVSAYFCLCDSWMDIGCACNSIGLFYLCDSWMDVGCACIGLLLSL